MNLPELGVGLVYWPGLDPLAESRPDLIQLLEIEPEAYWHEIPTRPDPFSIDPDALQKLRSLDQPKLVHGVGFPVGGSKAPDDSHLSLFATMVEEVDAIWASEHLSFNRAGPAEAVFQTGFLLPPLQTVEGVAEAVKCIRHVASRLPVPFAVETGVNYLRRRAKEMSDGEFVREVVSQADCGILLDLHNVWANERNGRQPVAEFLAEIPLERVWELHLAGGFEKDGFWLDAHSGRVPEPVMELAFEAIQRLPNLRAVVFEVLPFFIEEFGLREVEAQLERLLGLWQARKRQEANPCGSRFATHPSRSAFSGSSDVTPGLWENVLGALVTRQDCQTALAQELAGDPGIKILRSSVEELRAGIIIDCLGLTSRLIMLDRGSDYFRRLLEEFWSQTPPRLFASTEAEAFASFLTKRGLDVLHALEVLQYEHALLRASLTGENQIVRFTCNPDLLFKALAAGRLPDTLSAGVYEVEVTAGTASKA